MIVLDMEWNQPLNPDSPMALKLCTVLPFEIIQIGAVRLEDGQQFKSTCCLQQYRILSPRISKLTGISRQDVKRGERFQDAMDRFRAFCGEDPVLLTWGFNDIPILRQNLSFYGMDTGFTDRNYNLQIMFHQQHDPDSPMRGLSSAVDFFQIEAADSYHDGLADAAYTAEVAKHIDIPRGIEEYPDYLKHFEGDGDPAFLDCLRYANYTRFESFEEMAADPRIKDTKCPSCGFEAPKADYLAGLMDYEKMTMPVATPYGEETYPMISDSIFNLYNEMAAIAFCRAFGIEYQPLKKSLETTHVIESRYRKVTEDGVDIVTNMAKGQIAPAVTVAFEYAASRPGEKELVVMLDDFRDAAVTVENTAYLYDVDFEFFNQPNVSRIVVQGDRSRDYLLRCLLAGIPEEKLRCVDQLSEIPDQLALKKGTSVYILHDSYQVTVKDELVEALRKKIRERAKA